MKQKKKRNRKPKYNEGYRGTIMREMLEYGGAIYKDFHLQDGPYVMYTRKVKQMKDENIVEIIRNGNRDIAVLNDFEKNYAKYIEDFPLGTYRVYREEAKDRRHLLKSGDITQKERAFKEIETLTFMRNSKIKTNILEKTNIKEPETIIGENEVNFYTTKELGRIDKTGNTMEVELIEEGNENETTTAATAKEISDEKTPNQGSEKKKLGAVNTSRSIGCVISPGNTYVVYDLGTRMMEGKKATEMAMRNKVNMLVSSRARRYIGSHGNNVQAVVLASDDKVLERFITYQKPLPTSSRRKRKVKEVKTKFNIDFTYDKMYGLPLTKQGAQMMESLYLLE